jgi:hypothetical protein
MARKRGNGEGSVYRRKDGHWIGQYLVYTAGGPIRPESFAQPVLELLV